MPQTNSQLSEHELVNSELLLEPENRPRSKYGSHNNSGEKLNSVMSELNRLSKSFVDSYQNLEGQVEKLNDQLQDETEQKNTVMLEKQKLLGEKAFLSDRLQSLLAIMPAGVVVIDGEGKVKDCNAKAIDILGRPLLGELWITVINRVINPQADDGHQVSLKDGRKIHIETRALDVEPGQLVVLTDLTKSRQQQAEVTQKNKLSSMGKMIASLAHQIRTPLSAAILYGSHLNKNTITSEMKQEFSAQLLERLHFMERQINDMLGFIRGERKQKQKLSPDDLFKSLLSMRQDFSSFVTFEIVKKTDVSRWVMADLDSLTGAITNLIENACDACIKQESPFVKVRFEISDELIISISDNGEGISSENKKKIFEPFHTTKRTGNGLGLAIVHGIVIELKGKIEVESEVDHGTCFKVSLPLVLGSSNANPNLANLASCNLSNDPKYVASVASINL